MYWSWLYFARLVPRERTRAVVRGLERGSVTSPIWPVPSSPVPMLRLWRSEIREEILGTIIPSRRMPTWWIGDWYPLLITRKPRSNGDEVHRESMRAHESLWSNGDENAWEYMRVDESTWEFAIKRRQPFMRSHRLWCILMTVWSRLYSKVCRDWANAWFCGAIIVALKVVSQVTQDSGGLVTGSPDLLPGITETFFKTFDRHLTAIDLWKRTKSK